MSCDDQTGRGHQGLDTTEDRSSADGQAPNRRPGVSGWLSDKWRAMGGRGRANRDNNYLSSSLPVLDTPVIDGDPEEPSASTSKERKSKLSWSKVKKRLTESLSHVGGSRHQHPTAAAITQRALPPVPQADRSPALRMPPLPLLEGRSSSAAADDDPWDHTTADEVGTAGDSNDEDEEQGAAMVPFLPSIIDFATSIEKVKSYGWYWGPISRLASERLLSDKPDGSFIVRDSSADHYIFSLTFKLDNKCSHVRIENHHGNFSFGSLQNFKSNTIVDFIENAVEHSRSGRYLFFLHRRPQRGPMRVQLLNPVSRFKTKEVQSLQHMCRFVILKRVPRDLLYELRLPKRIEKYLDTPYYYSEQVADWSDLEPSRSDGEVLQRFMTESAADADEAREVHHVDLHRILQFHADRDREQEVVGNTAN